MSTEAPIPITAALEAVRAAGIQDDPAKETALAYVRHQFRDLESFRLGVRGMKDVAPDQVESEIQARAAKSPAFADLLKAPPAELAKAEPEPPRMVSTPWGLRPATLPASEIPAPPSAAEQVAAWRERQAKYPAMGLHRIP